MLPRPPSLQRRMWRLLLLLCPAGEGAAAGRKPQTQRVPPPAPGSGRVFRMAAGSPTPLALRSQQLHASLDPSLPRVINYTFVPTNQSFAAAVHGWGYHPWVKLNGGAVTCGEGGMATKYTRISLAAVNWTLTMRCALNYPTLITRDHDAAGPPSGHVTVVMHGSISLVDEPALPPPQTSSAAAVATVHTAGDGVGTESTRTGTLCSGVRNLACELSAQDWQVFPDGSGERCALCSRHSNCTAWNWNGPKGNKYCYGLTGCSKTRVGGGDTCQCGSTRPLPRPPAPAPPNPPPPAPPAPPPPPPGPLPASHMDWQLDSVNCSEASVPARQIDLIGFE
eukprot:SAG25_NODE_397_length_8510_cov_7.345619_1_plen_336_part_10